MKKENSNGTIKGLQLGDYIASHSISGGLYKLNSEAMN